MKGIVLLNGDPYPDEIDDSDALVYCCDGAYRWASGKVRIDKNVGDFDSLGYIPEPVPDEICPVEKDNTDGEIAVRKIIDEGISELEIYGGGGGREDHFLGNLQLLYYAYARGVKAVMMTARSEIFVSSGKIRLGYAAGCTVSVLPFGESVHIMDFKGLKYPYPKKLSLGECRGISNIVLGGDAYLETEGMTLIIVNRGEV